jgi:hypothetical protein
MGRIGADLIQVQRSILFDLGERGCPGVVWTDGCYGQYALTNGRENYCRREYLKVDVRIMKLSREFIVDCAQHFHRCSPGQRLLELTIGVIRLCSLFMLE